MSSSTLKKKKKGKKENNSKVAQVINKNPSLASYLPRRNFLLLVKILQHFVVDVHELLGRCVTSMLSFSY